MAPEDQRTDRLPDHAGMAQRIEAHDWATTPLGAIDGWPAALRPVIGLMLASPLVSSLAVGASRVLLYNDAAARLYDDRHPAALGRPLPEIWPEAYATLAHLYDRAFAGEAVSLPAQPLPPASAGEVFEVYLTPVRDEAGAVLAVHTTGFEVGARHRAEASLRQSEARYRAFVTASADVVYRMSPDWTELRQLDGRGFLADTVEPSGDWMDLYIEPEDRVAVRASIAEAIRTKTRFEMEHRVRRADGTVGWTLSRAVPILGEQGDVAEWLGAARDVTRQHETEVLVRDGEERYLALFNAIDQGFCTIEIAFDADRNPVDYRFLDVSPAFESQTGIVDGVGRWMREIEPDHDQHWFDAYGRVALTGEPARFEGFSTPLGRWWDVYAFRVEGPHRVAVLFRDITDQKRGDQELRESEARQAFLLRLNDTLSPMDDALEIERAATRLTREALGVSRVFYAAIEADGDTGVIRNESVDGVASAAGRHSVRAFGLSLADDWLAGQAIVIRDVNADPRYSDEQRAAHAAVSSRATIAVPLVKGGALVAVVIVSQVTPRDWSAAEVRLVSETANRIWDASQRARAEATLRDSEERLRAILETARDYVILTTDAEGRVETWSGGAEAVLGWTADEIVGQTLDFAFTPEDRAAGVPEWERRTARDEGRAPDVRWHLCKDGTRVFIEGAVRPLAGPDGSLTGFVKVGQDVTERRATQERLRASEALFRQFADGSPDVIWIRDTVTMRFDFVSPAFETIYGEPFERVFAANDLRRWARLILPEDRGSALDAFRRVRAGERVTHEFRIRRPSDGVVRWIRDTTFPLVDDEGRVQRVAGIGQDVTEMKRTEAAIVESEVRLRTLTEGIPQLVWRAVDHGRWSWASPQWTAFTGQAEAASLGWGWLDTLHPDDRHAARNAWERSKVTETFEAEFRLREAASGDYRWFQGRATQVRDEAGRLVEWVGTSTDVQDLREMQGRLRVLVAELQHRTRNLMGVILGVMRQTRRSSTDPARFAADFQQRIEALARVQGHLSRLDEGDRVDFDQLLRAELGAMGALNRGRRGARVVLEGPQGVRLRSSTVQTFALALHELATNALKYGALSQRDGRLAVRWWRIDGGAAPRLWVEWTETGVAMPPPGSPSQGSGYGRELIEKALPYQLGAETTFEMGPDGVRCLITLPLSSKSETASG